MQTKTNARHVPRILAAMTRAGIGGERAARIVANHRASSSCWTRASIRAALQSRHTARETARAGDSMLAKSR